MGICYYFFRRPAQALALGRYNSVVVFNIQVHSYGSVDKDEHHTDDGHVCRNVVSTY